MMRIVVLAAAGILATSGLSGQSLSDRIAAVHNGTVVLRFQTRPGVCGGEDGNVRWLRSSGAGDWFNREPCVTGPVRVSIGRDGNEAVSVRMRIGLRNADLSETTDLGDVSSVEAAHYLAMLARHLSGRNADAALTAAVIADGYDVWPDFRQLVLDTGAPTKAREQALFWIGQSDTPTQNLVSLYGALAPVSLREHYTFVLAQRRGDDAAVDQLIDVAKHDRDVDVRKQAMFWLGQMHDPKAVKFFREMLTP
jgi:hypothetical protein